MAAELGPFIQEEHAIAQRHLRHRTWPPPISPHPRGWWGARNGRVVTNAVRSPVRPATRWIRVVSMASARVIAGRMVVSRRASIDFPAPGGPSRRTFWAQRLHHVQRHRLSSGADYLPFTCSPHHSIVRAQAEPAAESRRVGYHMTKPPLMLIDVPSYRRRHCTERR